MGRRARSTGSRRRGSLLRSRCTELYYSHEHTRRPRANRELVERSQVRLLFLFRRSFSRSGNIEYECCGSDPLPKLRSCRCPFSWALWRRAWRECEPKDEPTASRGEPLVSRSDPVYALLLLLLLLGTIGFRNRHLSRYTRLHASPLGASSLSPTTLDALRPPAIDCCPIRATCQDATMQHDQDPTTTGPKRKKPPACDRCKVSVLVNQGIIIIIKGPVSFRCLVSR